MRVMDILRHKGDEVTTISPNSTLEEASRKLAFNGIGALVVSTSGTSVQGVLFERDVVRHLATVGRDGMDTMVADVMTRAETCSPSDSVEDLMRLMTDRRLRHVPVMVNGQLCGIVSIGDVVKRRLDHLENERHQLQMYIQTGR
jgi:CBS domain-containing protein